MIDTHCHVDMFADPIATARKLERELAMCVAVTMLPSHFILGRRHLTLFRRVVGALGLHPLRAREARREIDEFKRLAKGEQFIGEIGLDGSAEGKPTLALQRELFVEVVSSISTGVFVTVHSRGAWRETLEVLRTHEVGPVCFHYFTGGLDAAKEVLADGHYLSVNNRMVETNSRHRQLAAVLPREKVLIETDAPFLSNADPAIQLEAVYNFYSSIWKLDMRRVREIISENFALCRTT